MPVQTKNSQVEYEKKQVAILVENEFEDVEFKIPHAALKQAGAIVTVLGGRMNEQYKGHYRGVAVSPNATATEAHAEDFDAFVLLGGSMRANPNVTRLIQDAVSLNKWIVAIGYGPQVLIDIEQLTGKRVTAFRAIRKDLENAGATYLDAPVVVDAPFITARRPSDLPIVMTTLFRLLEISLPTTVLPQTNALNHEWWKMGEDWGGSSRADLVRALNMAIVGERYTLESFKQYSYRATAPHLKDILTEIVDSKKQHVEQLEKRLHRGFHEEVTWQALGSEAYADLQSWLLSSDDISIARWTLGDLQTGIVDAYRLCNQLTDPTTAEILDKVTTDLSKYEQCLGAWYRQRASAPIQPPLPTTVVAM
ncbi:MAG: DJ-1/PfpI family protein [Cyanobacteria bacterium J06560_6]